MTIPWPHREGMQIFEVMPGQGAFLVFWPGLAGKGGDEKDKAQPIFAVAAKIGPVHRAA